MTSLITYNPYRVLGVFSNSTKKDVLSNINKSKAFLKVGKEIAFPTDFNQFIPTINRTEDIIIKAQSEIERPIDQLKYSLFWFINASQFDDIALKHLEAGDISLAKDIWNKASNMSSLLNLMVCALIENNLNSFSEKADSLCTNYCSELCNSISDTLTFSSSELIDLLIELIRIDGTINISLLAKAPNTSAEWKRIVGKSLVKPIVDSIYDSISETKGVKGATANYNAGVKLMNSTKKDLTELKGLLGVSDMEYQMVADRLAQTILQCGITYFNETTDDDAPEKAMTLQKYALSIAVGHVAKDRCQENVKVLEQVIENLPPNQIFNEIKAIKGILKKSAEKNPSIENANEILNLTHPFLSGLKKKNKILKLNYNYQSLNTIVMTEALQNVIIEVKEAHRVPNHLITINPILHRGWRTLKRIGKLEMEKESRKNIFLPNKRILRNICKYHDVPTNIVGVILQKIDIIIAKAGSIISKFGCLILILLLLIYYVICDLILSHHS